MEMSAKKVPNGQFMERIEREREREKTSPQKKDLHPRLTLDGDYLSFAYRVDPKTIAYACEITSEGQAAAQEPQSMQESASIL